MYGQVSTDVGTLRTDLKFSSDKKQGNMTYSGSLKTQDFHLGTLLADQKLGDITFNVSVDGQNHAGRYPTIVARGMIESVTYSDYTYRQITLDGKFVDELKDNNLHWKGSSNQRVIDAYLGVDEDA